MEEHVFRDSRNSGAGGDHSGDIIFTQNIKPGTGGEKNGSAQTGDGNIRKNAPGHRGIRPLAGGEGGIYTALGK